MTKVEKIKSQRLGPKPAQNEEGSNPYEGLSARAIAKFKQMGFALVPKPEGNEPKLPRDVAALTAEANTNLHAEFVRWIEFAEQQAALWGTRVTEGQAKLEHHFRITKMSFDGTATEKVDYATTDPFYVQVNVQLQEDQATLSLVKGKCIAFEKGRGLLSRDVGRQVHELDMSRRERGIERVGQPRKAQPVRAQKEELPFRDEDDL